MGDELMVIKQYLENIFSLRRRRKFYTALGLKSSAKACLALANHSRRELKLKLRIQRRTYGSNHVGRSNNIVKRIVRGR